MALTNLKPTSVENPNSLITKAVQIMIFIVGLGLISMISSMLVAESLSGDAERINSAGKLRMLAVKVSRSILLNEQHYFNHGQRSNYDQLSNHVEQFDLALLHVFDGGLTNQLDDPLIGAQYQKIISMWQTMSLKIFNSSQSKKVTLAFDVIKFDQFVVEIDGLVLLMEYESENKIKTLRAIHGISLFSVIIVAFIVLSRINKDIISPLKKLVSVASAAGKGDFSLRVDYDKENELGLLSKTINNMSEELKLTHEDLEEKVRLKTSALSRSNNTLAVLFNASKLLSEQDFKKAKVHIIKELEEMLGFGEIFVEFKTLEIGHIIFDSANQTHVKHNICFEQLKFPITKRSKKYGDMLWNYQANHQVEDWQLNLIETIADMFASAHTHELERLAENRLVIIEERAVIARELHDSLAQSLSYLKIQVALLTKKLNKQLPRDQIDLTVEDIRLGLNRAYLQLRELLTTFRLQLDDPSLKNALAGTVTEFSSKSNLDIILKFDLQNNSLSPNQEIHVLQIVREALSNIHRHAKATMASVNMQYQQGMFILKIVDDGIGINKEQQLEGHFGLGIMNERAKSLNAEFKIQSENNAGTTISVIFS